MKKIEPEKWKTKAKQVESAAKDQEDKSARILELLFIYIWISGSVGTLRRTPGSSCSVLFLVLFPAFAPYCFVCLFACLPQFRPQKLLARGKLRGEQPGSGGKLSWVRWHFCILPIRSVAAGRKVCTAPFALLKTTKKMKIKARRSKLSPRNYFNSNLFCVCSKRVEMRVAPARIFRTIFLFVRSLSQLDCWMIMTMARSKDQNQDNTSSSGFQKRSPNGKWVLCECS